MTKSVDSGNLSIRLTYLSMITVGLPLSAFVFCIAASLVYHSKESTSTHCKVINYLPSVSTSIGNFAPQKYVWRVALGLHSTPRYLLAYLHFILVHSDQLTFTFSFIEITCLLGLSFVSSIDDFGLHAIFFTTFQICALLHMGRVCWIEKGQNRTRKYCALINFVSGLMAVYTYLRHNWYCEAGIYSLFALCEYSVVLSNMMFHIQVLDEFKHIHLELSDLSSTKRLRKRNFSNDREHLV